MVLAITSIAERKNLFVSGFLQEVLCIVQRTVDGIICCLPYPFYHLSFSIFQYLIVCIVFNPLHTLHKKKLPLISCCGNQGELMLYLCFFKRSRNHLRGFLIAACSALYKRRVQETAYLRYLFFQVFGFLSFLQYF